MTTGMTAVKQAAILGKRLRSTVRTPSRESHRPTETLSDHVTSRAPLSVPSVDVELTIRRLDDSGRFLVKGLTESLGWTRGPVGSRRESGWIILEQHVDINPSVVTRDCASVDAKGRIRLPSALQEHLGSGSGDELLVMATGTVVAVTNPVIVLACAPESVAATRPVAVTSSPDSATNAQADEPEDNVIVLRDVVGGQS